MGPIYHLFLVRGYREAYYQLSPEGRDQLWARVGESSQAAGAKTIVGCYSRWSNETYPAWGIEEYPNLQALQQSARTNEKNQHFRYLEAETYNGVLTEGFQIPTVDIPDPIYQLFLVKNQHNDAWASLAEDTRDRIFAAVGESIRKNCGINLIGCDINRSNEEYSFFGVTAWPTIEAEQAHFQELTKLGWNCYFYAKTILGTAFSDEI
ncbi:MAG: hypothetical protein QM730_15915 [Anaerolineales bacterium]